MLAYRNWKIVARWAAILAALFAAVGYKHGLKIAGLYLAALAIGSANGVVVHMVVDKVFRNRKMSAATLVVAIVGVLGSIFMIFLGQGLAVALISAMIVFGDAVALRFR